MATSGFSRAGAQFLKPVLAADEEVKQFPDSTVAAGRLGQRQVRLDLVTVAAAVVVLDDVARVGEVADELCANAVEITAAR